EQEGTYPLPEAQVDRFMMKVVLDYPSRDEERRILDRMAGGRPLPGLRQVATPADIANARQQVDQVFADDKVRDYVVDIVRATRPARATAGRGGAEPANADAAARSVEGLIEHGASSRAAIWLMQAAKAHAFLHERNYVTPHDAKTLAPDVLRHRIMLSYEAEAEGRDVDDVIRTILDHVLVP
ncbi:MAG: MoxR family ATPase, partial [Gammaproteobacteria bacterium]|nr:MoxR family ATPase [Gammaproteobacteria bacterium]